jgi:predicted nucleic acid-binding protein
LLRGKESYEAAAHSYFRCRRAGLTIRSTIALIIAQVAIENDLVLLHDDEDFPAIAKVVKEQRLYS